MHHNVADQETFKSVKFTCKRDIQVQELFPDAVNEGIVDEFTIFHSEVDQVEFCQSLMLFTRM